MGAVHWRCIHQHRHCDRPSKPSDQRNRLLEGSRYGTVRGQVSGSELHPSARRFVKTRSSSRSKGVKTLRKSAVATWTHLPTFDGASPCVGTRGESSPLSGTSFRIMARGRNVCADWRGMELSRRCSQQTWSADRLHAIRSARYRGSCSLHKAIKTMSNYQPSITADKLSPDPRTI